MDLKQDGKEVYDEEKIREFEGENGELLRNNLIESFLKIPANKKAYWKAISDPTPENRDKLDSLFKEFYFKIRFISHISSTLKFNSINFDKRTREIQSRFNTILDNKISTEDGLESYADLLVDEQNSISLDSILINEDISEQVTLPLVHEALQTLTQKQKQIINLAYVKDLNDTEIGVLLNKSQQAISKIHRKALKKLLDYIESKVGYGGDGTIRNDSNNR